MSTAPRSAVASKMQGQPRSRSLQYEIMLRELLAAAGESDIDSGTQAQRPSRKRLSCYVALMRELLSSGAFGGLSGIMAKTMAEFYNSLYVSANVSPDDLLQPPLPGTTLRDAHPPMFQELEETQQSLNAAQADLTRMRERLTALGANSSGVGNRQVQREVEDLQIQIQAAEQRLEERERELRAMRAEKRQLMEQGRMESQSIAQELQRVKAQLQKAEEEVRKHKGSTRVDELAKSAFSIVAPAAQQLPPEAEKDGRQNRRNRAARFWADAAKLVDQLMALQNIRIDKFETGMRAEGLLPPCGELASGLSMAARDQRFQRAQAELNSDLAAIQSEVGVLEKHLTQAARKHHIQKSAVSLMVHPDELESAVESKTRRGHLPGDHPVARRGKALRKPLNEAGLRLKGPGAGNPMWNSYVHRCEATDTDVDPRVPRNVSPDDARTQMMSVMRAKYMRDMDAKITPLPLAEVDSVEIMAQIRQLAQTRESLGDHCLRCLELVYRNKQASLLMMHGIFTALENAHQEDPLLDLMVRALGGEVPDPLWWCVVELARIVDETRTQGHEAFESLLRLLYPDVKPVDRLELLDEYDDQHAGDYSPVEIQRYFAEQLLQRGEIRYNKWLDKLVGEDVGRISRDQAVRIILRWLPSVSRTTATQAYALLAVSTCAMDVDVDALALVLTALELSNVRAPVRAPAAPTARV
ncbi:unnamed protein product [Pedinophyceae sp. YPF-701]|nr:unnamed protein product [Pedinophyceae sp. YPF-701]